MEPNTQTTETANPNAVTKGTKINETVTILGVSYTTPKGGERQVIMHTSKCAKMKTREGLPVERFKFSLKQWNNFVQASGKPEIIYNKQIVGGKYNIVSQFVEAGDAFLQGEGTYSKPHFARVSEAITMSAFAIANDTAKAEEAYYASVFSQQSVAPAPIVVSAQASDANDGSDIAA